MSRFRKKILKINPSCKVSFEGNQVRVEGPKGLLCSDFPSEVEIIKMDDGVQFDLKADGRRVSMVGLVYHLFKNMMIGVVDGFTKKLEINGVGYRWNVEGSNLKLQIGFSYDVNYRIPEDVNLSIKDNVLEVAGISKQRVGEVADEIRRFRPVEPYKGKGIKLVGEYVVRKAGKSGK